jgi:hypothetical protein
MHARSPHNQNLNFHHSYGGFKKWIVERYLQNIIYRKIIRFAWMPGVVWFFGGWAGMRSYDNAVYDYFYFFDAQTSHH